MTVSTVYATAATDGYMSATGLTYQAARQGPASSASTTANQVVVGQWFAPQDGTYACDETFLTFDTSGITGTVESVTLTLIHQGVAQYSAQPFDLMVRTIADYGALTTADWIDGAALPAKTLCAQHACTAWTVDGSSHAITLTGFDGQIVPDSIALVLSSSMHEAGTAPTLDGILSFKSTEAGGADRPKLTVTHSSIPETCVIEIPVANVGYASEATLTARAASPTAAAVRYHWDYSLDAGANWTTCPESPSAYVSSGTAAPIVFDLSALAFGQMLVRVRAYDAAAYSPAYAQVAFVHTIHQDIGLWRSAGTVAVADPISGVVIERAVSTPSTLRFSVDNFDAGEADIADGDELVFSAAGADGSSIYWRGFVVAKRVGEIMEVTAEDIASRFAHLRVTRTLTEASVGSVVKAIVENPTGAEATGITATCAEVDDPLDPGNYLHVDAFDGQSRYLADWLAELADWTGCQWYVYHDLTTWQFIWFDPAANTTWDRALTDAIEWESEPLPPTFWGAEDWGMFPWGTGAEPTDDLRVINTPTVDKDRKGYVNRVWYWRPLIEAAGDWDTLYTESATGWTPWQETTTVTASATETTTGTYSIRLQRVYAAEQAHWMCAWVDVDAAHVDMSSSTYWTLACDMYLDAPDANMIGADVVAGIHSGAADPTWSVRGVQWLWPDAWTAVSIPMSVVAAEGQAVLSAVDHISVGVFIYCQGNTSSTVSVYVDNLRILPKDPAWMPVCVETAPVTNQTESPIETIISTRTVDAAAAASLAQAYLAAYNKTRTTVENVDVFDLHDVPLDRNATLTLESRGIAAVDYPLTRVVWSVLDTGHITTFTLGDRSLSMLAGIERLVRRVGDVTAEVRA